MDTEDDDSSYYSDSLTDTHSYQYSDDETENSSVSADDSSGSDDDSDPEGDDSSEQQQFATGARVSADALASAYFSESGFPSESVAPASSGRQQLRKQETNYAHASGTANVLAPPARRGHCADLSDHFGMLVDETHGKEKVGYYVDRSGNPVAEVWESLPPPPNADYRRGEETSNRHLSRLMGYDPHETRVKTEVEGITNPTDHLDGDAGLAADRMAQTAEISSRAVFFNQRHTESFSDFDTGRDLYDGHNDRRAPREKVVPLERTWRHETGQFRDPSSAHQSLNNKPPVQATVSARRVEVSGPWRRDPQKTPSGAVDLPSIAGLPVIPDTHRSNENAHGATQNPQASVEARGAHVDSDDRAAKPETAGTHEPVAHREEFGQTARSAVDVPEGHRQLEHDAPASTRGDGFAMAHLAQPVPKELSDALAGEREHELQRPTVVDGQQWTAFVKTLDGERDMGDDHELVRIEQAQIATEAPGPRAVPEHLGEDRSHDVGEHVSSLRATVAGQTGAHRPEQAVGGADVAEVDTAQCRMEPSSGGAGARRVAESADQLDTQRDQRAMESHRARGEVEKSQPRARVDLLPGDREGEGRTALGAAAHDHLEVRAEGTAPGLHKPEPTARDPHHRSAHVSRGSHALFQVDHIPVSDSATFHYDTLAHAAVPRRPTRQSELARKDPYRADAPAQKESRAAAAVEARVPLSNVPESRARAGSRLGPDRLAQPHEEDRHRRERRMAPGVAHEERLAATPRPLSGDVLHQTSRAPSAMSQDSGRDTPNVRMFSGGVLRP